MKNLKRGFATLGLMLSMFCSLNLQAKAQEEEEILAGIYIEDMPMEGKTEAEAEALVDEYVNQLMGKNIKLVTVNDSEVIITPADIGFFWCNREIIAEAAAIGQKGNVVQRYKMKKDLQFENKVFELEFDIDKELVRNILKEKCSIYNVEAQNPTLTRVDDEFVIEKGQTGCVIDEEASLGKIYEYIVTEWNGQDATVELIAKIEEPSGSEEELKRVQDVLGTFSTSFKTSNASRSANVKNGCELINGITLFPGEEFSCYGAVSPFTVENGYFMAGSYLNGRVVDSLGGGICQVSTTLYNAVLLAELEVTERHNHSMIVTYVSPSADAAIAESSGKDFKFVNNTQAPVYIEGYTTEDKQIVFNIYGEESRPAGHSVAYKSEVVSQTYPDTEVIYVNEALPLGEVSVQSAHIGYKANLWKVIYENNEEVSREKVNSSAYNMAPRTATVGVATADPNAYNEIMAAIATNNIDHVKNVAAALAATAMPPTQEVPAPEEVPVQ